MQHPDESTNNERMRHPDEGMIHAWIDGALSEDEASAIERHVAACPVCAEQVAEARGMIAGASRIVSSLDVVRGNVIPRSPALASTSLWRRLHLTPTRAALAATVLLAVGSMLAVRESGLGGSVTRRLGDSARSPRAAVVAPAMAPAPAPTAVVEPSLPPETRPLPQVVVSRGSQPRKATPAEVNAARAPVAGAVAAVGGQTTNGITASTQRQSPDVQRPLIDRMSSAVVAAAPASQPAAPGAEAKSAGVAGNAPAQRRAMEARKAPEVLAGARNLTNVVDAALAVPLCYQVDLGSDAWLRAIPQRFMLARDTLHRRNVVRAIVSDSTLDVEGAEWTAMPDSSSYRLLLPSDVPNQPLSLVLNESGAQASGSGGFRRLIRRRIPCPR